LLLAPKLQETAKEIDEDIKGNQFFLLSTLRPHKSGDPERWHNLLAVLWHEETTPTSWLRHIYGASLPAVQEIAESSDLNKVYRCLDCEDLLETRGRNLVLRRRKALNTIFAADAGDIVSTRALCDLLCPLCTEVYVYNRLLRINELRAMPYREYLHSQEWQRVREAKLKEAGRFCHACRKVGIMDVHHNTYDRLGDEDIAADLFIFCRACHERQHGIRRDAA
jgi:5-methylcytosine-specific restriction endonuclease McrA